MTKLDDDLAAYQAAATAADRQVALLAWLMDATPLIDTIVLRLQTAVSDLATAEANLRALMADLATIRDGQRRLVAFLVSRRVVFNPTDAPAEVHVWPE